MIQLEIKISAALQLAKEVLQDSSDAPQLDADRLLLHVLGQKETSWIFAHAEEQLSKQEKREFQKLVQERATGKPLAYILGEWEFYGRSFYVTPDVLVPRPETENLIEAALPYIDVWREKHPGQEMVIADLGTGSGIIAVTLARELATPSRRKAADSPFVRGSKSDLFSPPYEGGGPSTVSSGSNGGPVNRDGVVILATDISPAALKVATKNAQWHGVEKQIEFIREDMALSLGKRKIDLIVSNPPYVPTDELNLIPPQGWNQGLRFEPRIALDGGWDGQDFVRQIQASGIPALVETTGGTIKKLNL